MRARSLALALALALPQVSPKEIAEIEPSLNPAEYYGGFFTPSDFTGDIHRCAT